VTHRGPCQPRPCWDPVEHRWTRVNRPGCWAPAFAANSPFRAGWKLRGARPLLPAAQKREAAWPRRGPAPVGLKRWFGASTAFLDGLKGRRAVFNALVSRPVPRSGVGARWPLCVTLRGRQAWRFLQFMFFSRVDCLSEVNGKENLGGEKAGVSRGFWNGGIARA